MTDKDQRAEDIAVAADLIGKYGESGLIELCHLLTKRGEIQPGWDLWIRPVKKSTDVRYVGPGTK